MVATANTKVSETTPPPLSALIGTGNRSASVAAATSAAKPISSRPLCGVVANEYPAATSTPKPATQTGRMRTASLFGVTAWELMPKRLPGQLFEGVPRELSERGRNERQDSQESDQTGLPLQHKNLHRQRQTAAFSPADTMVVTPYLGDLAVSRLEVGNQAERPASARRRL